MQRNLDTIAPPRAVVLNQSHFAVSIPVHSWLLPFSRGKRSPSTRVNARPLSRSPLPDSPPIPEQFLLLVTCRDEKHQVELLERFGREGLECKALLS
jgi:hypothetical protein